MKILITGAKVYASSKRALNAYAEEKSFMPFLLDFI